MFPHLIAFARGAVLQCQQNRRSDLPIHRNGPPGTFVIVGDVRVSLPTDQIVSAADINGHVVVGFGGFRFDGLIDGQLTFTRVRDLLPEDQLSPDRSWTMKLNPAWVSEVRVSDAIVYP